MPAMFNRLKRLFGKSRLLQKEPINIPNRDYRVALLKIEKVMFSDPRHVDGDFFPLKHSFANGMYVREIFVPKGYFVMTYVHKQSHPAFQISGDTTVIEPDGNRRLKGYASFITKAGTKRICYCHEDTIWVTVHLNPNNKEDIKKIEDRIYATHYSEIFPNSDDKELEQTRLEDLSFMKLAKEVSGETFSLSV